MSEYQSLCALANISPVVQPLPLDEFVHVSNMAETSSNQRLTAAVKVLMECISDEEDQIDKIDRTQIDYFIAKIDQVLSQQMDEVLHHIDFQTLESDWRGLKYLVDRVDYKANTKTEILDLDKESLYDDFDDAADLTASGLYEHIYAQEYDTPGGEPFGAIISHYDFDSGARDLDLLRQIAKVAEFAHCPFIGSASPAFFNKKDFDEVTRIEDLNNYFERSEYIAWRQFRETEAARYIGLTLPRFLLRLPYGQSNPVRAFSYEEGVAGKNSDRYLWGNSSLAFGANLADSFKEHGWAVNIRGPESGGKVTELPLHQYDLGRGLQTKIPTEHIIPESREMTLSDLGFIPLSYYKNSDYACFFSANSIQLPAEYADHAAAANSRINSRLPYVFLISRIGHYIKVFQRENIGSNKSGIALEKELNAWLQTLVTKMNNPSPELAATYPLREGFVNVSAIEENPGFYHVSLYVVPHFQVEGVDVRLSLVAQLPGNSNKES